MKRIYLFLGEICENHRNKQNNEGRDFSKSRTGEAIYRSNEFHKKILEKKVKQFKSATETASTSGSSAVCSS
jgi:hypothetical protein